MGQQQKGVQRIEIQLDVEAAHIEAVLEWVAYLYNKARPRVAPS